MSVKSVVFLEVLKCITHVLKEAISYMGGPAGVFPRKAVGQCTGFPNGSRETHRTY